MAATRVVHATDDLPTGEEKTERVRSMFDAIAPRYDLVNRIMSLGLDQSWRRATVDALALAPGSVILDLACGTGDLSAIARRRGYRTVGVDLSWGMLVAGGARTRARRRAGPGSGLLAGTVAQADAAHLPFATASVDGLVCGYALRNFTDLGACLAEAARVVRPGGRIAVLEVAEPPAGVLRAGYRVWFEHVVPLLGGALSDRAAYRYLPRSTAYLPPPDALRRTFVDVGFSSVGRRLLNGGLSQLLTATRAGLPGAAG